MQATDENTGKLHVSKDSGELKHATSTSIIVAKSSLSKRPYATTAKGLPFDKARMARQNK